MPRISDPIIADKLRRRFEISGEGVVDTLSPEIVAVVLAEDLTGQAEGPWREAYGGLAAAASGAGNQNQFFAYNPPGSGVLVQIIDVKLQSAAADRMRITNDCGVAVTISNYGTFRDSRISGTPNLGMAVATGGAIVLGGYVVPTDVATELVPLDIYLLPGCRMVIRQNAQNSTMEAAIRWRERDLLQKES